MNKVILSFGIAVILTACGNNEKKSLLEDEARARAVTAAKALIATDHSDNFLMEGMILDAKAIQSEYIIKGDTLAADAFDNAFREYITTNDSVLAKELFSK